MFAVTVGRLGHGNAEIVAALGTGSGYVSGHGGDTYRSDRGRVNRGMDRSALQFNPAGEMSIGYCDYPVRYIGKTEDENWLTSS